MNSTSRSERRELGRNMTLAFKYIQQIFKETAQLMRELDKLMGRDWKSTYGNRTTINVTSHLTDPENWLVAASFRIYDSINEPNVKKGITVPYWPEKCDQPILIAGKIDYILDSETGKPKQQDYWDLWRAWFSEDYDEREINGTIYQTKYQPEDDYIKEAIVFAIPLVSIQGEDDIRTKIYDKLIAL